jgi:hypothetical protein
MRNATNYLHSLTTLRFLDAINVEINAAESLAPALVQSLAHEARRVTKRAATEVEITEADRAWFRRPLGALAALVTAAALALGAGNASADPAKHVDSAAVAQAKREVATAKERLHDVRASERAIKATAHDTARAHRLHVELARVEAKLAAEGK